MGPCPHQESRGLSHPHETAAVEAPLPFFTHADTAAPAEQEQIPALTPQSPIAQAVADVA